MKAKEMFKKLGYKQQVNDDEELSYEKKITIDDWEQETINITFWLNEKVIDVDNYIDIYSLQAKNKQVEELGWLDER